QDDLYGEPARPWVPPAFWAVTAGMALSTWWLSRRPLGTGRSSALVPLLLGAGAVAAVPIGVAFLVDVAAPAFLRLPHHCAYCLASSAPVGLVAVGLFLLGVLATGWAAVARGLAAGEETRAFLPAQVSGLLHAALFGWLGAAVMVSVRLLTWRTGG